MSDRSGEQRAAVLDVCVVLAEGASGAVFACSGGGLMFSVDLRQPGVRATLQAKPWKAPSLVPTSEYDESGLSGARGVLPNGLLAAVLLTREAGLLFSGLLCIEQFAFWVPAEDTDGGLGLADSFDQRTLKL